jgi:hypothetical protein
MYNQYEQDMTKEYEEAVTRIQNAAKNCKLPNSISYDLTYQQALSIYIRSCQLEQESLLHPNKQNREIKKQIEECYKQRNM